MAFLSSEHAELVISVDYMATQVAGEDAIRSVTTFSQVFMFHTTCCKESRQEADAILKPVARVAALRISMYLDSVLQFESP